jgi:hypothetical protein
MENFLRPVLIKRGADLPLLLITWRHWRPPSLESFARAVSTIIESTYGFVPRYVARQGWRV